MQACFFNNPYETIHTNTQIYKYVKQIIIIYLYNNIVILPISSMPEGLPTFSRRRCKSFGLNPSGGE